MSDKFNEAANKIKKLKSKPTDAELLDIYSLFKQASIGDCNTARPGMLDFKGKAKWDAWNGRKDMSKDDAEDHYVDLAEKLVATYGVE